MISQKEIYEEMGAVSFLFPKATVRTIMERNHVQASNSEVNYLWKQYEALVMEKGVPPYSPDKTGGGNLAMITALEAATGYARGRVVGYLNAVVEAVRLGHSASWLDPRAAPKPLETLKDITGGVGDAVGAFIKPVADPVTNIVKYAAIGIVGAGVIYAIFHGTKLYRISKRRRAKQ